MVFYQFENRETQSRRLIQRFADSGIPGLAEGQVARRMGMALVDEIQGFHSAVNLEQRQRFLSTASGPYLDLIGEMFGLTRLPASEPRASASDRNVYMYVESGYLKDYLPQRDDGTPFIPKGTIVYDKSGATYQTETDVLAGDFDTEISLSVAALQPGTSHQVPAHALTMHNLGSSKILVDNRYPITNGSSLESDDNFRFRLSRAHLAMEGANRSALELEMSKLPGVSEFRINENAFGPGTVEIVLIPVGSRVSTQAMVLGRELAYQVLPRGTQVRMREPSYREFEVDLQIVLGSRSSAGFSRELATNSVYNFFENIGFGRPTWNTAELKNYVLGRLRNTDVIDVRLMCFLVNSQLVPEGVVRMSPRDMYIPNPDVSAPVKVFAA